jgi:hypothetical protein
MVYFLKQTSPKLQELLCGISAGFRDFLKIISKYDDLAFNITKISEFRQQSHEKSGSHLNHVSK